MYHNDQWCMIHSGTVISTDEKDIIKSKVCGYQYPVMVLLPGDFCVGLGVKASKETDIKLKFNKLLSLR